MNVAAAAVFDPVAAAPPARPAPVDEAQSSFDGHLDAQQTEPDAPKPRADAAEEAPAPDAEQQIQPDSAVTAPAPIAAAPIVLHLALSDTMAPQPPPDDTQTGEATPVEPSLAAPQAGLPSPQASPRAPAPQAKPPAARAPDTPAKTSEKTASDATPKIAAPETPAPNTPTPSTLTPGTIVPAQAAPSAPASQQEQQAGPTPPPDATLDAIAALQAAMQGLKPARTPANASAGVRGGAPESEPDTRSTARASPAAQAKTQPKTAAAALQFANDTAIAQRLVALDEAAPPPQQSAGASVLTLQDAPHAQHILSETAALRAAPLTAQVSREIIRRFNGQNTQFDLRLDPPELGRIDVRLEVTRDHRVTAIVAADTPQALAELVRHARELEQSLQSAGLQLAENGLSFDLRQGRNNARETDTASNGAASGDGSLDETPLPAPLARPVGFETWRGVRLDVTA